MYKTLVLMRLIEDVFSMSTFMSTDRDGYRNPKRFINKTIDI